MQGRRGVAGRGRQGLYLVSAALNFPLIMSSLTHHRGGSDCAPIKLNFVCTWKRQRKGKRGERRVERGVQKRGP